MQPLVAIILVNYNGFEDTVECVKSLKNIHYRNYIIVVVDNGSNQKNIKEIEYLKANTEYVESVQNLGFSGGNNLGIKYCQKYNPDFYLLLNNDTLVENDFLDILVETYDSENIGIVCGKIKFCDLPSKIWFAGGEINRKNGKVKHWGYFNDDNYKFDYNQFVTFATGCMWLIPKTTIDIVGYLEEDYFLYCEDTDYCYRVLNKGLKILYNGKACIYHKIGSSAGRESDLQNYYIIRNSLEVVRRNVKIKFLPYTYIYLSNIKKVLQKKILFKTFLEAISDFKCHKVGKRLSNDK